MMAVVKDSGFAWVVLGSSLVINFMCIGFCFGVISVLTYEYTSAFGEEVEVTKVSWIGSILFAVLFLSGPIGAFLIGKLGVRTVAVISVLVHIAGFTASAFATQWWHIIPAFIFVGLASCCSHICTMKILTVYFDRHQHAAYAASTMGGDVAAVVLPFVTAEVLKLDLSYRDSILCLAAMLVLTIPCAASFKGAPAAQCLKSSTGSDTDDKSEEAEERMVQSNGHTNSRDNMKTSVDKNHNDETELKPLNQETKLSDEEEVVETLPEAPAEEHHTLKDHIIILLRPPVLVFVINSLLWNVGGATISVLTYTYCEEKQYHENADKSSARCSLVMVLFGVGSFIGSLGVTTASFLCHRFKKEINRYYLHMACNLIMGITGLLVPVLSVTSEVLMILFMILGAGYGTLCSNLGSIIEHLNGSHLLYLVYGYEMAAAGVGSLIGPVIGSQLDKAFGNGMSFYFSGATMLAALVCFIVYAMIDRSILIPYSKRGNNIRNTPRDIEEDEQEKLNDSTS